MPFSVAPARRTMFSRPPVFSRKQYLALFSAFDQLVFVNTSEGSAKRTVHGVISEISPWICSFVMSLTILTTAVGESIFKNYDLHYFSRPVTRRHRTG